MTFGIFLSLLNHLHFGDTLGVLFEFIPQIVFMLSTFGYMIFLIIYKFCIDWYGDAGLRAGPPNLIQTMIGMFLSPGTVSSDKQLYPGQGTVQGILVLLAFISIPAMLIIKPCIIRHRHKQLKLRGPQGHEAQSQLGDVIGHAELKDNHDEKELKIDVDPHVSTVKKAPSNSGGHGGGHDDHGGGGEYSFSDHFITQCIHTIEFVLGAVSNTASYLRLWALSLAHAELAAVFWDKMIMQYGVSKANPAMVVIGFAVWAAATFAVLLCMDVLECFLHALRLHWVEFQNKFFHADGYAFQPFDFNVKASDA